MPGAFVPLHLDFLENPASSDERNKDAQLQAEIILYTARQVLERGYEKVGITYGANPLQVDKIREAYANNKASFTDIDGSNQADVLHRVHRLLQTNTFRDLTGRFYLLPVTTAHIKQNEIVNAQKEDVVHVENFIQDGGLVLGWQNTGSLALKSEDKKGFGPYALGGGVARDAFVSNALEATQEKLKSFAEQYNSKFTPKKYDVEKKAEFEADLAAILPNNAAVITTITSSEKSKDNFLSPGTLGKIRAINAFDLESKKITLAFEDRVNKSSNQLEAVVVDVMVNNEKKGSFEIQRQRIFTKDNDIHVAVSAIKAFMAAKPGKKIVITPKDQQAYEIFNLAVAALSQELTDNKANVQIKGLDGKDGATYTYQLPAESGLPLVADSQPYPDMKSDNDSAKETVNEIEAIEEHGADSFQHDGLSTMVSGMMGRAASWLADRFKSNEAVADQDKSESESKSGFKPK